MSRMKGLAAIFGAAMLMAVVAACASGADPASPSDEVPTPVLPTAGGTTPTGSNPTPIVSHGGPVDDYVSLVDSLRAAGATVVPAGTVSADFLAPEKQLLTVNGEDIQAFEFGSAEEADAAAGGVSATGSSIVTTMADGTGSATMVTWALPPHFYKAGKLIVLYVGCDSDAVEVLQEIMGPQFAGGAGVSQCPDQSLATTEIGQALQAADGAEVTVSGFLVADRDGVARLCSGLLESNPPQCGGDRIDLLGFNASSVPNSRTPREPSEIRTARWTDSHITVTGIKGSDGLADVRLSTESPSPIVSHGGPAEDYVSLVDSLRAAGATALVVPGGTVSQPFFAPEGQLITVDGQDVQAFEFASAEEADAAAETVSADGSSIGTSMVGWVAPPHFYKAGKLIVIYVGSDGDVIDALQEAMGSQFAGGER